MAQHILVLSGPNLNLLGTREPSIYGHDTLADIMARVTKLAQDNGAQCHTFQTNHEGAMVDRIHAAREDGTDFVIINPGAFTHTSVAVRDALLAVSLPFFEVHLSNTHKRETFRHHSYFTDVAVGMVMGMGAFGYEAAMQYALRHKV